MKTKLGLIILKTKDIERLLKFYEAIGTGWVEEKHGKGPKHYSASFGEIVLEIYPSDSEIEQTVTQSNTVFSFNVESIEGVLASLQEIGVKPILPPKQTVFGLRAIVLDPDNRAIELIEPFTA